MPEARPLVVVDSGVLIAVLNREQGRYEKSRELLDEAEGGGVELWAPAVLLVEVLHWSHDARADESAARERLDDFLDSEWLNIVEVDKRMARLARRVVSSTRLNKGVDALYVATAVLVGASHVVSWDERLATVEYENIAGRNPSGSSQPRLELPD